MTDRQLLSYRETLMTAEVQIIACRAENETIQEKIHALEEVIVSYLLLGKINSWFDSVLTRRRKRRGDPLGILQF